MHRVERRRRGDAILQRDVRFLVRRIRRRHFVAAATAAAVVIGVYVGRRFGSCGVSGCCVQLLLRLVEATVAAFCLGYVEAW